MGVIGRPLRLLFRPEYCSHSDCASGETRAPNRLLPQLNGAHFLKEQNDGRFCRCRRATMREHD
jgi:hypothetical protein